MGCDHTRTQLGADVRIDPGAAYEACAFPGAATGRPFVVLCVGELSLFFESDEAICEFIDALSVAAQELVVATGPQAAPLLALQQGVGPAMADRSIETLLGSPQLVQGEPSQRCRPVRPGWTCLDLLGPDGPDWLSINETAAAVGVSRNTLCRWRRSGQGPSWIRLGGKPLYRRVDVLAWLGEPTQGVMTAGVAS